MTCKFLLTASLATLLFSLCLVPTQSQGLYWLQDFLRTGGSNTSASLGRSGPSTIVEQVAAATQQAQVPVVQQQQQQEEPLKQQTQQQASAATTSQDFTVGGFKPANIASLLNSVSETGFSYFNVQNQCRSRTACDMGHMLYKKLNFVHNWIIRATVRTLVDSQNQYAQSWNNGMMGRNCTLSYPACHQSPLESLMSVAMMSGFFNY